jgi:hypothetical protein
MLPRTLTNRTCRPAGSTSHRGTPFGSLGHCTESLPGSCPLAQPLRQLQQGLYLDKRLAQGRKVLRYSYCISAGSS